MRLERFTVAAVILIVLASVPPVASAASPAATIVSPTYGATIVENANVRIQYSGFTPGASSVAGYVTLGGETVATFVRPISNATNGTFSFDVRIDTANVSSGWHALDARVFSDLDDPVDTPKIGIGLDKAPTIPFLQASYDLDLRRLTVMAQVLDDGGAPAVQLTTGVFGTYGSFLGYGNISIQAPFGPGTYNGTLRATDERQQTRSVRFEYEIADREAVISTSHVAYELGGKLRIRGNASDADGIKRIAIDTPLGNGTAILTNNSTAWSALFSVTPKLGTFAGTIRTTDTWGGTTDLPFSFTIGGPNVTLFERTVETGTGAYADTSDADLPAFLGGAIEICVGGSCGPVTPQQWGASDALYDTTCDGAWYEWHLCRQLTGRLGLAGAFDLCGSAPPANNLVGSTLWSAVNAAHKATLGPAGVGPCSDLHAYAEKRDATGEIIASTGVGQGAHMAIRAEFTQATIAECRAIGAPRACLLDAPVGTHMDLSWAQGIDQRVTVRVVGVRV